MSPDDERHGTRRGYYAHRKDGETACDPCKRAAASAEARYQLLRSRGFQSRLPAIGVQRRLHALATLGWTWRQIDDEMGLFNMAQKWAMDYPAYVFPETHRKIAETYDRLSMTFPPEATAEQRAAATRARNNARRKGFAPPLCWGDDIDDPAATPDYGGVDTDIDPVVVMRLLEGRRVNSTRSEREAAMARWIADGGSQAELCRIHGWKEGRYKTGLRVVRAVAG